MWLRLFGIFLCLAVGVPAARAEAPEEFYSRHAVTLLIGYPSGSAYDIYARLVGRNLGRHIPGKPTLIISNQPGASSLIAANALANTSPRDGSVIGAVFERIGLEPLVNPGAAKFDGRAFHWIGSILRVTDICMYWHAAPAKTIEDAKKAEVIVGAAGEAGGSALAARALNTFVGTKFRIIGGYGGADMFLAMERGETQARCGMSWGGLKASRPDWVEKKLVNVVVQMAMQKHPELPDVPLIMDMVSREEDREALRYLYATQEMGRPFLMPPGTPMDRVEAVRNAFDAMAKDPLFLEDARRSNQEVDAVPGRRVQEIMEDLYKTPRTVIDKVEALRAIK